MRDKVKGVLSILIMLGSFQMMLKTKYHYALGDYVLEFIGLNPWTGNHSGIHLTVLYFGGIFLIGIFLVEKFAVDRLHISRRRVFLIFVVCMTVISLTSTMVAKNIKKNSSELLAIGYNSKDSNISYKFEDKKYVEFVAEFELINYSDVKKIFNISIDSPYFRKNGIKEISFQTFDGEEANFELESNEAKFFSLNMNNYKVSGGNELQNGSGTGIIEEIVLTNNNGSKVRLYMNNFFGIELGK